MQFLDAPAGVPLAPVEDILAERIRQVLEFGHTPEADLARTVDWLPRRARELVEHAIEDIQFHKPGWQARARRRLARAGAIICAAMDRIDAAPDHRDAGGAGG